MWECFRSLGDLYCRRTLCTRWGRDRLGNYPCLMNTKIRIWLKSTEMARQQVRDAPGELWAAQIYPQAFLKMFFFFFWISIVGSFEPRMLLALKGYPWPRALALMLWGQPSASVGLCHTVTPQEHRAWHPAVVRFPFASGHAPRGKFWEKSQHREWASGGRKRVPDTLLSPARGLRSMSAFWKAS